MNTSMILAKTVNKCTRILAWSTIGKPRSSPIFKPSKLIVEQRRFYNDRNDWREINQRGHQSGMDATYEMPNSGPATTRYDEIYLNRQQAPRYEGNVEHEGFDPRYDDYHFKRQPKEYDQYDDESKQHPSAQMGQHDGESRRRMTQDPVEHKMRQERIIEENRRKWQNRTEPKREVHANGISYNIDKVLGGEKTKQSPNRVVKNKQTAEEYSRNRRAARQNELRRTGSNMVGGESGRSKTQTQNEDNDFNKPSEAWLDKKVAEENDKHWHSWNSCPDERSLVKKAHRTCQERKFQQKSPFHPYDVTRRGLHQQRASKETTEVFDEQFNNLKEHAKARVKTAQQAKSEYLLSLMQQDENNRRAQEDSHNDVDDDEEVEECPPVRRRVKPATAQANQPTAPRAEAQPVQQRQQDETDEYIMSQTKWRRSISRNHSLRVPHNQMQQRSRSISPPRFQMSVKAKVTRKHAPVCCFSDTLISRTSTKSNNHTQYRDSVRPSISASWNNFTSSHFSKGSSN